VNFEYPWGTKKKQLNQQKEKARRRKISEGKERVLCWIRIAMTDKGGF